jgi:hypothetical protein
MVLEPAGRDVMASVAFPLVNWTVPSIVLPLKNVTGPVGTTVGDEILAVNVTACPSADGFGDALIVAVLEVASMTWVRTGELLRTLLESPRYVAVTGYDPAFNFAKVRVATPLLSRVAVPRERVPQFEAHVNATVPVGGVGATELTFAVRTIVCPYVDGFRLEARLVEVV